MAFPAFNTMYMSSIGEYGFTEPFNDDPSSMSKWICWILFIISTVVIQLIMLNLIIAIISATYEEVMEEVNASIYLSRARLVVDNIHWCHPIIGGKKKLIEQRSKR
jgi:ABC-type sugar transport system permease subunit